jgi:hypothetical protein
MFQKYGAAIVSILLIAVQFVRASIGDGFDNAETWQMVALVAAAFITFLVPLFSGKWAGLFKTGATLLGALATAIVPFALQGFITPEQITTVALAVLTALGVEVGVQARKSGLIDARTAKSGTAAVITSLPDPEGAKALGV